MSFLKIEYENESLGAINLIDMYPQYWTLSIRGVFMKYSCLERREMRSATQGEKAALVQELRKEGHRLNDLLDIIGLSRSTYYYELRKADKVKERNADLSSEIVAIFNENQKRYGVRRVHHELLNRGFQVNHKRVQRIMNQLGGCIGTACKSLKTVQAKQCSPQKSALTKRKAPYFLRSTVLFWWRIAGSNR